MGILQQSKMLKNVKYYEVSKHVNKNNTKVWQTAVQTWIATSINKKSLIKRQFRSRELLILFWSLEKQWNFIFLWSKIWNAKIDTDLNISENSNNKTEKRVIFASNIIYNQDYYQYLFGVYFRTHPSNMQSMERATRNM